MRAILLICQKELKSYFASPIAYLLMAFFGLIFGFGIFTATRDFIRFSFQMQFQGQSMPMNINQQITLGKWLGAMLLYLCILLMSVVNIALLFAWGKPDIQPVLVAYLGLILQAGVLLGIGEFISTTTRNQIIAGGVTFFVCLLLWLLNWMTSFDTGPLTTVLNYLSIVTHFDNFSRGILETKDLIFYVSMIFFSL